MKILVIGGTRFFGIHMVEELLKTGHDVTIATRGLSADGYSRRVQRIVFDRTDADSVRNALSGRHFDVIIDKLAYCSNDIKSLMDAADCNQYIHMSTTAVYEPKHRDTVESDFDENAKELVWCSRPDLAEAITAAATSWAVADGGFCCCSSSWAAGITAAWAEVSLAAV